MAGASLIAPKIKTRKPFKHFLKQVDYRLRSRLDTIFILEKGKRMYQKLSKAEAIRKILLLNRLEFNYYKDHLFLTYSYFNDEFDVDSIYRNEEKMIKDFVIKNKTFLVRSDSPHDYIDIIEQIIKQT